MRGITSGFQVRPDTERCTGWSVLMANIVEMFTLPCVFRKPSFVRGSEEPEW